MHCAYKSIEKLLNNVTFEIFLKYSKSAVIFQFNLMTLSKDATRLIGFKDFQNLALQKPYRFSFTFYFLPPKKELKHFIITLARKTSFIFYSKDKKCTVIKQKIN